ncbi:hypothetical protein [Lachnobacterium bovis]|jgi:ElaB/YqjD/DUF883 family membrane-anchored ribosome-binding protein|uniref:Uncharacterized protein n=1 Tax=Lachnobacterium bovis DSM 14045 TaxID=1122142 RepID=A0A1H3FDW8_9FIRM|nr:hypothetical protein [Lachnobacterium bovis]MBQ1801651.1 hypothetical protein [Lachnobacterium sp.]SDX88319.1 hypothetical protein SAMN02910414_00235 [Lachnobacterium bovis DSM 14045]
MKNEEEFKNALRNKEVPLLVVDQKWHRLFAIHGKTQQIQELEDNVNELLKKQAHLKDNHKNLKKIKNQLMKDIVDNMVMSTNESDYDEKDKILSENKRLITEINEKLEQCEDELIELPKKIARANEILMIQSMSYCYDKMHVNSNEANMLAKKIKDMRIELKKSIIKKQNRDINNREIYSYMHDILGHDIIDLFDIRDEYENKDESE